jgi:hypothetical protein
MPLTFKMLHQVYVDKTISIPDVSEWVKQFQAKMEDIKSSHMATTTIHSYVEESHQNNET